jgi:5'-nucleotidase
VRRVALVSLFAVVGTCLGTCLGACGSSSAGPTTSSSRTTVTTAEQTPKILSIMVTNDDGVGAPGINAVVQGLRALPDVEIEVVAPLTNQSGTGERTTPGTLVVSNAKTASGYPAIAVHGYPADTVIWAIKDHGLKSRPDLVVSGINFGQNIGPLASGSGTVGAAREAVSLGIPAIATSQGIDDGLSAEFSEGVPVVVNWVVEHRSELLDQSYGSQLPQGSINIPSCSGGKVRGTVTTVMAASGNADKAFTVDCTSTSTTYSNDLEAFEIGFATLTPLYPSTS